MIASHRSNTTIVDIPCWLYMHVQGLFSVQDIMLNDKYHIETNRYQSKAQLCWITHHPGPATILSK